MAHLLRLIFLALVAVCSQSHALVPAGTTYKGNIGGAASLSVSDLTIESLTLVCQALVPGNGTGGVTFQAAGAPAYVNNGTTSSSYCGFWQNSQWKSSGYNVVIVKSVGCPAHSLSVDGGCKCDTGYEERDGQCKTPQSVCVDKATQAAIPPGVTQEFNATKAAPGAMFAPRKVCIESCQAYGTPSYWACGGTSCTVHFEKAAYTGQPCSGDGAGTTPESDTKPTPPAERCPDGKVPGSVNGTSVCVTPGEAGAASGTTGSTSTSGTNADGTPAPASSTGTGTKSSTSCDGTDCTTTTTRTTSTTNGSGQTSTQEETTTKKEPQVSHCAANPKAKECAGNEPTQSSFSGACDAGFVAKGDDAVLNAMAKEQYTRNCEILRTDTEPSTWALAEGQKTGNAMQGNPNNGTASIGPSSFDTSDALGGGSCNLNKTVVVRGYSVALPFNVLCNPLAVLGQILVAVSLLLAARIVTRG